ncbi:MAG: UDP-glucose dehydrogenase family protein [bacterium]
MKKIGIVGTGYVGLVTGACVADFGNQVICVDIDEAKVRSLREGKVPFFEPGLAELVSRNVSRNRLSFTSSLAEAVAASEILMIAVGTPTGSAGEADLKYVEEVARGIGRAMTGYRVIVTKSTVPTGTGALVAQWIRESQPRPIDFDVASNPEFLREGSAIEDFMRPDRIIIGASSERALEMVAEMYKPLYLIETTIVQTDVPTAEMIKYASNAFLATKISFINEMARLCDKVGADVSIVAKSMGLDKRIGPKFLHAGAGYGGSCFPKDTLALAGIGERHGEAMQIVKAVIDVNKSQRDYVFAKVTEAVGSLKGKTVAVLGIAFKPNTDDIREAPAIEIIERILASGGSVRAFDPVAMQVATAVLPTITYASDPYDAASGADLLLVMTEWNEFRELDLPRLRGLLRAPVIVDARNVYTLERMQEAGFRYLSVGRRNVG